MKTSLAAAFITVPIAAMLCACTPNKPTAEALRSVRTVEVRYDQAQETNRYVGTVQSRHEVDQAFRVGGKIARAQGRRRPGGARGRRAGGARRHRLPARRGGSAPAADRRHGAGASGRIRPQAPRRAEDRRLGQRVRRRAGADPCQQTSARAAEAEARQLELARNRLKYTVLRASQHRCRHGSAVRGRPGGRRRPAGRVHRQRGRARDRGRRAGGPAGDVQGCALQGIARVRTRGDVRRRAARARRRRPRRRREPTARDSKPADAAPPAARRDGHAPGRASRRREPQAAAIPAAAITQDKGQPAVWVVRRAGSEPVGTVELLRVAVHGYRNDEVLVSGPPAGDLVVTAGRAEDGARTARRAARRRAERRRETGRPNEILQPHRMGAGPPRHRPLPDPRHRDRRHALASRGSASSRTRTSPCRR